MTKTTAQFIEEATLLHDGKYDYSKTIYKHSQQKVIIICPIHGECEQTPSAHLSNGGCKKCGLECNYSKRMSSVKTFIDKANLVHESLYTYENAEYKGVRVKLIITCKYHGDFMQLPSNHLSGNGCPICRECGWNYQAWEDRGNKSRFFDSFKLYTIECWDNNEHFIKIGKTFTTLGKRLKAPSNMPYQWRLLKEEIGSAHYISNKEKELHNTLYDHEYTPSKQFAGSTECFTIAVKEQT